MNSIYKLLLFNKIKLVLFPIKIFDILFYFIKKILTNFLFIENKNNIYTFVKSIFLK